MADNQDARPFIDLKKDAEEFRQKFDEDIQKCMSYLDDKLTALICEPETLGSPSKKNEFNTNPLVEFSKAKYEIFISVKSMINEMEREWLKYVSEMKKLFIENVEILLAGTKLEVKLPISNFSGFKKSPLKERTSIAGSIYPIINTFAKNVAALGSPLRNINDGADEVKVIQSNQLKRDSAKVVLRKLVEKATTSSPKKYVENDSSSEDDSGNISRRSTRNSNDKSLKSSFGNSTNHEKSKSTARISRKKSKHSSSDPETSQETSRSETKEKYKLSSSSSPNSSYQNSETTKTIDKSELSSFSDHKILHESSKSRNTASSDAKSDSSTGKVLSSSKRKGRKQSMQTKQTSEIVLEKITESEDESNQSTKLTIVKSVRTTRSGRTPAKSVKSNTQKKSTTSEESGTESNFLLSVSSGKKKKAPTRQKLDISSVTVKKKKNTEVSSKAISNEDASEGLDTPKISLQSSSPKKSNLLSTGVTPAADLSRSHKKVTFTANCQNIDDIAVLMSDTRPTTSRRRKTLFSNLDGVSTDMDITPRNSRSLAKRKTIGGISNVTSAPSPKRLKVGGDKKCASLVLEGNTDDNLLESDGNYSDWMSLTTVDGRIPTKPGIYEVKVWRAKKPAYIGHCESLRQMLTLHKLKHNSGHKHLDKFIDRNMDDIQIRFEVISSIDNAKNEVKNRLKCFVARYHTTPAYN